jgi:hypothetical protein
MRFGRKRLEIVDDVAFVMRMRVNRSMVRRLVFRMQREQTDDGFWRAEGRPAGGADDETAEVFRVKLHTLLAVRAADPSRMFHGVVRLKNCNEAGPLSLRKTNPPIDAPYILSGSSERVCADGLTKCDRSCIITPRWLSIQTVDVSCGALTAAYVTTIKPPVAVATTLINLVLQSNLGGPVPYC